MSIAIAAAAYIAFSPRALPPIETVHIPVQDMQLNGIERTSSGLLIAGELGKILVSQDQGNTWTEAQIDQNRQALITRLMFVDERNGLALGHEGWILRTEDGGRTWSETAFDESNGEPLMSAARLPDGNWLVIGAFGRLLLSTDDRKTWEDFSIPGLTDWHLNAIASSGDQQQWLIVGEAGTALRSVDKAGSWEVIEPFYNGSLYGAVHLGGDVWITYGMRGHVFRSEDAGLTWQESKVPAPVSLYSHLTTQGGELLLFGQGGLVLSSADSGKVFRVVQRAERGAITDVALMPDGRLALATDGGLDIIAPTRVAGTNGSQINASRSKAGES
jgi:photosystem II stability/assembly factor-like uncharacterized protein